MALVDRAAYDATTLSIAKRAKDGGVEYRWLPLIV